MRRFAAIYFLILFSLSAIAQRGARKDFIDLYTLIQRHRPLPDFLDLYQKKYAVCDVTPVLYGMVYFDHAVAEPLPEGWQGSWRELEDAFRLWVREIGRASCRERV